MVHFQFLVSWNDWYQYNKISVVLIKKATELCYKSYYIMKIQCNNNSKYVFIILKLSQSEKSILIKYTTINGFIKEK